MLTISQAINQGVEFQKRGELDRAEQLYRQVLEADARHADAWHLLGLIAYVRGDAATALVHIGRAIKLDPLQPSFHNHQGEVYRTLLRLDEAKQSCRQALALKGDFALAHNTLGLTFNDERRFKEAEGCFRRAIALDGGLVLAHFNLAVALRAEGRLVEALAACRQALACDPALVPAYQELGTILRQQGKAGEAIDFYREVLQQNPRLAAVECSLGATLQAESRTDEAIACYHRALAIETDLAEAHCGLGRALEEFGQRAEAEQCYRRALQSNPNLTEAHCHFGSLLQKEGNAQAAIECYQNALRCQPDYAVAHHNLGVIYEQQYDLSRAAECYTKAIQFDPRLPAARNNLGNVLKAQGRIAEADACYEQAVKIDPNYAQARFNQAMSLMAAGNYAAGWPLFEWRWECPEFSRRSFDRPCWRGESLDGRTLLVYAEQGLGDTLQFVRFVPQVAKRAGRVILEVQRPLVRLLAQSGLADVAQLVAKDDSLPSFDATVSLVSLPGILGVTLDNIPAAGGYFSADSQLVAHWRRVLGDAKACQVGIAWQGNPAYLGDRFRSIRLAQFAPLALDGVELVSLQKGFGAEQLADVGGQFRVRDLAGDLDEAHGPFIDTAAVMKNLDLVVTSDTVTAHLAGALGVRVWVALPLTADWRWMYNRSDSPWYASMKLFRQTRFDDWTGVLERLTEALGRFVRTP